MLARFWCVGFAVEGIGLARLTGLCLIRGVRDCVGAVDGIVLAAHNASMCALMYLFVGWVAAPGCGVVCGIFFIWGICDSLNHKSHRL